MTKIEQALLIIKSKGTCSVDGFFTCKECSFRKECWSGDNTNEDLVKICTKFILHSNNVRKKLK